MTSKQESYKKWYEKNKEKESERRKKWNEENKERKRESAKKWYEENKEKEKIRMKEWKEKNKEKWSNYSKEYYNNRRKSDPLFKLSDNIRGLIRSSLRNKKFKKKTKTIEILGCSYEEFKQHLEKQFEPWMNWDNYGKYNGEFNFGWDIDHIVPASSANDEKELFELNHYTNLKPLCSKVNRDIKKNNLTT